MPKSSCSACVALAHTQARLFLNTHACAQHAGLKRINSKAKVKFEEAGRWQEPPVLRRERLHAGGVAEIRLLEMHDKMDKMMVWMNTGQVDLTHCRTVQQ